ncbi:MAG: hypothetical protein Q8K93_27230 [Reyranella sp.]|nr:hypothetical protein [Reyranella sp.]MDP1965887.1 hypothetical protein [Reyranella sp.]MDP2377211.1 hypothetical protein [Reyranella sp.]
MFIASLTLAQANKIVEAALADARRLKIKALAATAQGKFCRRPARC